MNFRKNSIACYRLIGNVVLVVFVDDEGKGEKGNELKPAMCTELSSIFKLNLRSNHCH